MTPHSILRSTVPCLMMVALVAGILAGCGPTTVPSPSGMPATEEETDSILRLDAPTSTADTHRTMAADSTATVQNEDTTEETASGSGTDTDSIANARKDLALSLIHISEPTRPY